MRYELESAIILHRRAWRDTSMLVEAFTREHGRIGLVAKGARSARSRWRGLLEPLSAASLSWSGRGQLYTLTGVELQHSHSLSGKTLISGLYAAELTMRLTAREDPHPLVHDGLASLLSTMDAGAPAIVALRFFERDLLDETGYGLTLTETSEGEAVRAELDYTYRPATGLFLARGGTDRNGVRISGRALLGLVNGRLPDRAAILQARELMEAALRPHLGSTPLKSVQTLRAMHRFADTGRHTSGNTRDQQ